jgi:hypothetical protein
MILRHPFFRTPLGRAIEIGGAAALIAKSAAIIRDWEPAPGGVARGYGQAGTAGATAPVS